MTARRRAGQFWGILGVYCVVKEKRWLAACKLARMAEKRDFWSDLLLLKGFVD